MSTDTLSLGIPFKADLIEAWALRGEGALGGIISGIATLIAGGLGGWRTLPRGRRSIGAVEGDPPGVLAPRGTWDVLVSPSKSSGARINGCLSVCVCGGRRGRTHPPSVAMRGTLVWACL